LERKKEDPQGHGWAGGGQLQAAKSSRQNGRHTTTIASRTSSALGGDSPSMLVVRGASPCPIRILQSHTLGELLKYTNSLAEKATVKTVETIILQEEEAFLQFNIIQFAFIKASFECRDRSCFQAALKRKFCGRATPVLSSDIATFSVVRLKSTSMKVDFHETNFSSIHSK
jgi:hypothetical protein